MTRVALLGDAEFARVALIGRMSGPIVFEVPANASLGRRSRLIVAVLASLVLLICVGVLEVGALAAVTIMSSTTNHGGGQ
jgi:hypothetical protein